MWSIAARFEVADDVVVIVLDVGNFKRPVDDEADGDEEEVAPILATDPNTTVNTTQA
jgi:hypothetical protein